MQPEYIYDFDPQDNSSWMDDRRGKFTASRLGDLLRRGRRKDDAWGDAAMTYIYEIINAILTGQDHIVTSKSMEWGHDHEWEAIEKYMEETGEKVQQVGFVAFNDFSGGSPDGLVREDGIIEVKCPFNGANHIRSIIDGYIKPEYQLQIQGNLLFTGRQWCDFVSYDPRQEEGLMLHIIHVKRDEEVIEQIRARITEAKEKLDHLLKTIQHETRCNKESPQTG